MDWRRQPNWVSAARMLAKVARNPATMTEAELRKWEQHVRQGHVPYDRHCATCVRTAGTGRAHGRVLAPSAYVLSLHIAGPFRAGGKDVPTKGISLRFGGFLNASTYKDFDLPEKMDQVDDCDADPLEPEEFPCEEGAGVTMAVSSSRW